MLMPVQPWLKQDGAVLSPQQTPCHSPLESRAPVFQVLCSILLQLKHARAQTSSNPLGVIQTPRDRDLALVASRKTAAKPSAHTHTHSLHWGQQQHEGIPDQPDFYIKTGNCPSLHQKGGRASWPVSVSLRNEAGTNSSLLLILERI